MNGCYDEGTSVRGCGHEGTRARGHEGTQERRREGHSGFARLKAILPNLARFFVPSSKPSRPLALVPSSMPSLLLLVLALFAAGSACAQSNRIQIEVLVFAYNNPDSGSALSPADPDPVYSGMLLGEGGAVYSALPREALKLGGAYDALARNARTRALLHVGWQQDAGSTRPVRLRGRAEVRSSDPERGVLATANPELDGDLRLRFGRGVEVHVDALLRVESRKGGRATGEQRFRLNSKRIVNYGELHYIDHPALGIIVRVDRVEDAAADATGSQ